MEQTLSPPQEFPGCYNHPLLDWRRRRLNLSTNAIARFIGGSRNNVEAVMRGCASSKKVYPVAQFLGVDWAKLHDLELTEPDYPSALRNDPSRGAELIAPAYSFSNST